MSVLSRAHRISDTGPVARRAALVALGLAAVLASLGSGCVAADPMPSPGRPDQSKILVSSTSALRQGGPVDVIGVIGLKNAAPGLGLVEIRQPFSESITIARTGVDGTFAAVLAGAAGDRLILTFREFDDGPASPAVDLSIGAFEADSAPGKVQTDPSFAGVDQARASVSAPAVTAPDGRGRTTVTGTKLTAGEVAAIANPRTGDVLEVTVPEDGAISVSIPAATGDTILLIIRNATTGSTSQAASLSVPAP